MTLFFWDLIDTMSKLERLLTTGTLVWLAVAMPLEAQPTTPQGVRRSATPAHDLEEWVELALERNLALRTAATVRDAGVAELEEARGTLRPALRLSARYSVADGGRVIPIPVGDLVNPIYGALESLPEFEPGAFPRIPNEQVPFLLDREQDTRLEIRAPIFRPEVRAGVRVAEARASTAADDLVAERARVRREVEAAWYGLRSARARVAILGSASIVVEEALRTAEARADAGEITRDEVLRLRAERLDLTQQQTEARLQVGIALAAFNRVLDRPLDAAVPTPEAVDESDVAAAFGRLGIGPGDVRHATEATRQSLEERALHGRAELRALGHAVEAAAAGADAARARWLPTLDVALDVGIQGREYRVDDGAGFVLASVVASWDVWSGGRRSASRERADLQRTRLDLLRRDAEAAVRLEVRTALADVLAALESRDVALQRVAAAEEAWRLTERRWSEGVALSLTLLDARDARTRAELDLNTIRFRLLDRLSALARAAAMETPR